MTALSRPRPFPLAGAALAASAVVAGVWALRTFDPNQAGNPFPACVFNALTGLFCPGCGATRALHALVHFDLARALSMNVLIVFMLPTLPLIVAASHGWRPRLLRPFLAVVEQPRFWLVAIPLFGVLRNLPAFAFLAPG